MQIMGPQFAPKVLDFREECKTMGNRASRKVCYMIVMERADGGDGTFHSLEDMIHLSHAPTRNSDESSFQSPHASDAVHMQRVYHARRVCECVDRLHSQGFVHLDLKPSHFMLFGGQLRLIDYGSVKRDGER